MNFQEKKYSSNIIELFNKKITKLILKSQNFKNFLKFDYCNKEYFILLEKIKKIFTNDEIILFSQTISNNKEISPKNIAKYYIKLTHLFSTIFNITSKYNLKITNNKLNIDFNNFLIPEINYIYESEYDFNLNEYILNNDDLSIYNKILNDFSLIFCDGKERYTTFSNININNITKKKLNSNKMLFSSYFNNYTFHITLLIQELKNINIKLIEILNSIFNFDDELYIKNIISMKDLDIIIDSIRDILINYFNDIQKIYNKTVEYFRLFVLNTFSKTIKKRIDYLY